MVHGKCLNLSGPCSLIYKAGDMRSDLQTEGSGALSSQAPALGLQAKSIQWTEGAKHSFCLVQVRPRLLWPALLQSPQPQ